MTAPEQTPVIILGRFPPPVDGQSVATLRLADLLGDAYPIERLNTNFEERGRLQANSWLVPGRWRHYFSLSRRNRDAMKRRPGDVILWPAVSPDFLGHFRDLLTVVRHKRPDQKLVAIVHRGNFEKLFESPATRLTASRLVRHVDVFVFNDAKLSAACADWIPNQKRFAIPNVIEASVTSSKAEVEGKQAHSPASPFRLVYISNMIESKGYGELLEATAILLESGASVETIFVGRWPSRHAEDAFHRRVAERHLAQSIQMIPGVADRDEIRRLHLSADAFVLPTYYKNEAQPLSIIEALSAGTPVISTRHRGIPLMIEHGTEGFLVSPRSPEAIAAAIRNLMQPERWLRMSVDARGRFEGQFHPDVVRRKWIELIDGLAES